MNRARLALGGLLLVLSLLPYALIPAVPLLDWSLAATGAAIGAMVLGAEVVGALAVLVLGCEAVAALRRRLFRRSSKGVSCRS